jgi:hypothetical protein
MPAPNTEPTVWLVYPLRCSTADEKRAQGVRVASPDPSAAWQAGALRLCLLCEDTAIERLVDVRAVAA